MHHKRNTGKHIMRKTKQKERFRVNFFEKLKKTFAYYKSLDKIKPSKPQDIGELNIRSDYVAFLTCPYPVIKSEKRGNNNG